VVHSRSGAKQNQDGLPASRPQSTWRVVAIPSSAKGLPDRLAPGDMYAVQARDENSCEQAGWNLTGDIAHSVHNKPDCTIHDGIGLLAMSPVRFHPLCSQSSSTAVRHTCRRGPIDLERPRRTRNRRQRPIVGLRSRSRQPSLICFSARSGVYHRSPGNCTNGSGTAHLAGRNSRRSLVLQPWDFQRFWARSFENSPERALQEVQQRHRDPDRDAGILSARRLFINSAASIPANTVFFGERPPTCAVGHLTCVEGVGAASRFIPAEWIAKVQPLTRC